MNSPRTRKANARSTTPAHRVDPRIMAFLTRAMDWFEHGLQNVVESSGFEPVHRTHSMILMHIAMGIDAPSEIARELGLTRQNVHHMAKALIERGIIESIPDPDDPRRSRYHLSEKSSAMRRLALETMADLERVLEARIGPQRVASLREALATDWGPPITSREGLRASLPGGQHKPPNDKQ